MRILLVGGNGTIGRQLQRALGTHEVIVAGRSSGDVRLDVTDPDSIQRAYEQAGELDAVVCVAASGPLDTFGTLTAAQLRDDMRGKLFGQIELVLVGQRFVRDGGSFTLTSGVFADIPYRGVTGGAVTSGALHSFVLSAALELPRALRINVVSPSMVDASAASYGHLFPGLRPVAIDAVASAFVASVETGITGQILRVY